MIKTHRILDLLIRYGIAGVLLLVALANILMGWAWSRSASTRSTSAPACSWR